MARARNIKPGFFKNEILGVADPIYSLLFEGLWVLADRSGRLEDRPLRIKGELFPYRDGLDMEGLLSWLQAQEFILRYTIAGKRYIQVVNFVKHQNPHKNETESEIPSSDSIGTTSEKIGSARACLLIPDSLIPDSPFLIPDSSSVQDLATLSPEPPVQDLLPVDQPKRNLGTTRAREAKPVPLTAEVWAAYTAAYCDRYGVDPVRNAKVNGQLANLVARLGGSEAPAVASFYVRHNFALYVRAKHPADLLLRDCEGLRTEWATGRTVTGTEAQQQDRKQNTVNAFAPLLAEAQAREANGKH